MSERDEKRVLPVRPRCQHCGEIIGVYEPMVVVDAAGPRHTSMVVEPELPSDVHSFHRSCYQAAGLE